MKYGYLSAYHKPSQPRYSRFLCMRLFLLAGKYCAIDPLEVFATLGLSHLNNCLQGPGEHTNSTGYVSHARAEARPRRRVGSIVARTGFLSLLFESSKWMTILSNVVRVVLVFLNMIISAGFTNLWLLYLGHLSYSADDSICVTSKTKFVKISIIWIISSWRELFQ